MTTGNARDGDEWSSRFPRWDAYFAVVYTATLIFILGAATPGLIPRVAAAVLFTVAVPWYIVVGRPALLAEGEDARRSLVYLIGAVALFLPPSFLVGEVRLATFALAPQCFMLLWTRMRRALVLIAIVNLVPVVGWGLIWRPAPDVLFFNSVFAVVTLAFSAAFGGWIIRIITQSAERADLIAELDASREAVARLSAERGALAERARMSREIHDTLAQGFTSLLMLVQAVESELDSEPEQARRHLGLMARTARENLAEARALVAGDGPTGLEDGSLPDAVRRLAVRHHEQTGAPAAVAVTGPARALPPGVEVVILRGCQESLANARRHAGPDARVTVSLEYTPGTLCLRVRDAGRGFDTGAGTAGYGLAGIRARAGEIGGTAGVTSAPGDGTEVVISLPTGPLPATAVRSPA
ncbi:sensor histidine kinase [Streptomyces sp. H10-C2]|uniref:sensor histidine kinase n=1 Tax=unclassified Streptomyces TaxID=2593676 RepID=UPI0024B950B7|nr:MULTISPECIES: sensor histidine kinase [unclassified Streptomyces]MDJ0345285.1 sensor histidine kinase [Streptomyces sp. PH10-H1]MDJ0370736.1 sensor histidine kinase [Streptomyces sp. H10-C2]